LGSRTIKSSSKPTTKVRNSLKSKLINFLVVAYDLDVVND